LAEFSQITLVLFLPVVISALRLSSFPLRPRLRWTDLLLVLLRLSNCPGQSRFFALKRHRHDQSTLLLGLEIGRFPSNTFLNGNSSGVFVKVFPLPQEFSSPQEMPGSAFPNLVPVECSNLHPPFWFLTVLDAVGSPGHSCGDAGGRYTFSPPYAPRSPSKARLPPAIDKIIGADFKAPPFELLCGLVFVSFPIYDQGRFNRLAVALIVQSPSSRSKGPPQFGPFHVWFPLRDNFGRFF